LSDVADCIADELTNPKWESEKDPEVKELVKEKDEAVNKIEEDISPGDVTGVPPEEEEEKKEEEDSSSPVPEIKMANNKRDVLAAAVRQSLLNFFEN
jgi:hypothetical protein